MENNLLNGRVNILSKGYPKFDYVANNKGTQAGHDIVSKSIEHTPVSALFFSKKNIDALQQGISNQVYNKSQGKYNIGKQSEIELKIIMRSFYFESLQNGSSFIMKEIQKQNNLTNVLQPNCDIVLMQVRELNKKVLDWSVGEILTNLQQFDKYKRDVSMLPDPIDRPTLMSSAGNRSLEFQSFF